MNPVIWYIAQFDLVCDRRWMVAAAKSIFMAGITCGTVVCGFFADRYGMNLNIQMRVPFVYGTKFSHHCARTCPSTLAGAVLTEKTTFIHTSFSERQWFCIYIRFVDRMMSFKIDEEMSRNRTALPVLPSYRYCYIQDLRKESLCRTTWADPQYNRPLDWRQRALLLHDITDAWLW